jgi:hypothetical protein
MSSAYTQPDTANYYQMISNSDRWSKECSPDLQSRLFTEAVKESNSQNCRARPEELSNL